MSGGVTQMMFSSLFIGTIGYVTAVVAQYYGAGKTDKYAEATFQAVVLSLISYPIMLSLAFGKIFLPCGRSIPPAGGIRLHLF